MTSLLLAFQFLTILPVRIKNFEEKKLVASMMFFPVVGFFVAVLLGVLNNFLFLIGFNNFITGIILVITLIIITGGMHLDGLSDTFDAIAGAKSKEDMLAIMRDPRAGVAGVLSIICVLLLKISFLSCINPSDKIGSLILMCVSSRWSLVFLIFMFPYAREQGKGKIFSSGINLKIFIAATIFSISCAFAFLGINAISIMIFSMLVAFLFGGFMVKKIGGITGDTLGAACELVEVAVLFLIVILTKAGVIYG